MAKTSSFFRLVGINLAVFVAGLIVIEIGFGNWIFGPDYRDMNIPRDTQKILDVSELYDAPGEVYYTRDEYGFRGAYKDVSDIDILTLGGSTTNQIYVDDQSTWQFVMAEAFMKNGKMVSVVNAGVDGQSTVGHLAIFDRWFPQIPGLGVDYFLVYAGINDTSLDGAKQFDEMRSPALIRRIKQYAKNKSALYEMYRTLSGMVRAHNAQLIHGGGPIQIMEWQRYRRIDNPPNISSSLSVRLENFEDRLMQLTMRIRDFGSNPIFVTQPSAGFRPIDQWIYLPKDEARKNSKEFEVLDAFNRRMMDVCKTVKAVCVNLAHELTFQDGDFYDHYHNTDTGAERIGVYLEGRLRHLF